MSHRAWKGVTDRGGGPPGGYEEIGGDKGRAGRMDTKESGHPGKEDGHGLLAKRKEPARLEQHF